MVTSMKILKKNFTALVLVVAANLFGSEEFPGKFLEYVSESKKTNSIDSILFPTNEKEVTYETVTKRDKKLVENDEQQMCLKNTLANAIPASSNNEKILTYAKEYLGHQYGYGNNSKHKIDCSAFIQQVYHRLGVNLPRSASKQSCFGIKIGLRDLKIGDLLFYRTYKSAPSHVAIYAGDGKIIHASYIAQKVQYDSINKPYYKERFLFAKRIN